MICSKEGRPLLAIDFDGLGRGFDRNGEYVQVEATQDRYRKRKFDLKLRFSRENNFAYHIVASDEFNILGDDVRLTVVDAIIGEILARTSFRERVQSFVDEHAGEVDTQTDWQDLIMGFEIDCEAEHSIIWQKEVEVRAQVKSMGCTPSRRSFQFLDGPGVRDVPWPPWEHLEEFKLRLGDLAGAEEIGGLATLFDTPVGEVSEIFMMRNVSDYAPSLVHAIADLMVWSKLLRLLGRH